MLSRFPYTKKKIEIHFFIPTEDNTLQQNKHKMPMTLEQRKANEAHFTHFLKMKNNIYTWKDNANVYDMSNGRTIKPQTMKGFVEICSIVRRDYAKIFIDLPDVVEIGGMCAVGNFNKDKILDMVYSAAEKHYS
jgi:hypothetical protein